jgi:hypothetical protein
MIIQHDNKAHQAACVAAEAARQTAVAAANGSAAIVKAAEIIFYRSVVASCQSNNLPFGNFTQALRDLGTGGQ